MRGVYISGLQRIVVGSSKMLNELMLQGSMIRTQVLAPGRAWTTSVGVHEWARRSGAVIGDGACAVGGQAATNVN